jgi:hypothetical protein
MKRTGGLRRVGAALAASLAAASLAAAQARTHAIEDAKGLDLRGVAASASEHRGQKAVRVVATPGDQAETLAIVPDTDFGDGTIELELAGQVLAGASEAARGFVGLAFRLDPKTLAYDAFYLRPTNGRAMDQLRRNHSTQYISHPDFPWHRLRKEQPGVYESYVDLEPGAWTRVRIEVKGGQALLYVHGASQPTLVVTDMKRPPARGAIALWVGTGTEAFFRGLTLTPAAR